MATTPVTLDAIAAAQKNEPIFAYDRGCIQRHLARLQRIYAAKLQQLEAFFAFFDEGQPDIVLRSASQELALRLPACNQMGEVYAALRDGLDNELRELERQIVLAHLDVERDERETKLCPYPTPDYVPAIQGLCVPGATASGLHLTLERSKTAEHSTAAAAA